MTIEMAVVYDHFQANLVSFKRIKKIIPIIQTFFVVEKKDRSLFIPSLLLLPGPQRVHSKHWGEVYG